MGIGKRKHRVGQRGMEVDGDIGRKADSKKAVDRRLCENLL